MHKTIVCVLHSEHFKSSRMLDNIITRIIMSLVASLCLSIIYNGIKKGQGIIT